MSEEFEIARSNYIAMYHKFKEVVVAFAASTEPGNSIDTMNDISADLSLIEAAGWRATPEIER